MTDPTRKEIIDAHQVVKDYIEHELDVAHNEADIKEALRRDELLLKFLPPLPRLTMAEIEWDDDKHYLAEADHPGWGKVIMLGIGEEKLIDVFIPHLRKSNCIVPRGNLTPTGKRYTLTEVQE